MHAKAILEAIEKGGDIKALCAAVPHGERSAVRAEVMAMGEAAIADARAATRIDGLTEVQHGRYHAAMDLARDSPAVGMRDRLQRASWLLGRGGA